MRCDLERSAALTSMWRMDEVLGTLWCRAHVSRSVYRGTAVTSTILGIVFPVLS